jgi:diguanylate cyclase (GGDEF)-like protein
MSQMTGASALDIFLANITEADSALPLKASRITRGEYGYFYVYFDSDPEGFKPGELELGDFRDHVGENFSYVDTVLMHKGLTVGTAKVLARASSVNVRNQRLFLKEKMAEFEVNKDDIAQAIEVKNIMRVQKGRALRIAAPLIAEQKVLGVINMTIGAMLTGFDPELLENMLRESCKHISLAIKKAELYEKAVKDGMTGLYNKPHFMNQLNMSIGAAMNGEARFCLLMFDIDHFKQVNDTYGHLTGDIILIGVANILRRNLRELDMAFRYGGEELAIILHETGIRKASKVANRIRKMVRDKTFTGTNGQPVNVTISIGVSQYYPDVMAVADELISRADQALYRAKEGGRDRVVAAKKPRKKD